MELVNHMSPSQWQVEPTDQFEKDSNWYEKKRPAELAAVLNNLSRYLTQLNHAKNAACVQAGYLHNEPHAVRAIDQSAGGKSLQETRLYTYADDKKRVLYLITIGNKSEQAADIKLSSVFALSLRESTQT